MSFRTHKLRSNSFKATASRKPGVAVESSKSGHTPTTSSKTPTYTKDIDQLSSELFKNLQGAFDANSNPSTNDEDLLSGKFKPNDSEDYSRYSEIFDKQLQDEPKYSNTKDNYESDITNSRYRAVAEFAKNRVQKLKDENPGAYMRYRYNRDNTDAGPFALTTLNYEGQMQEKQFDPSELHNDDDEEEEDPDAFLKMEAVDYKRKMMNPTDDLEELRRMIKSTKSMLGSYEKETVSLKRSVRDLNTCASTIGLGVGENRFSDIENKLQEIGDMKSTGYNRAKAGSGLIKSKMPNKVASPAMGKLRSTTSSNNSRPPVSSTAMPRLVAKKW